MDKIKYKACIVPWSIEPVFFEDSVIEQPFLYFPRFENTLHNWDIIKDFVFIDKVKYDLIANNRTEIQSMTQLELDILKSMYSAAIENFTRAGGKDVLNISSDKLNDLESISHVFVAENGVVSFFIKLDSFNKRYNDKKITQFSISDIKKRLEHDDNTNTNNYYNPKFKLAYPIGTTLAIVPVIVYRGLSSLTQFKNFNKIAKNIILECGVELYKMNFPVKDTDLEAFIRILQDIELKSPQTHYLEDKKLKFGLYNKEMQHVMEQKIMYIKDESLNQYVQIFTSQPRVLDTMLS